MGLQTVLGVTMTTWLGILLYIMRLEKRVREIENR
jgi:CcmD family protein